MQDTGGLDLVDDPWSTYSKETASKLMKPASKPALKGLHLPVTDARPDYSFVLVSLTGRKPIVLLDQTLDMNQIEIWRFVMCNHSFHRNFLNTSSCDKIALGSWSLNLSKGERMPSCTVRKVYLIS